jgi:hypothetical protein
MIAMPQLQTGSQWPRLPTLRVRHVREQALIGQYHHAIGKVQVFIQIHREGTYYGLIRLQLLNKLMQPLLRQPVALATQSVGGCVGNGK